MIFQGIRTSIAKKPYSFVIFQVGGPDPCPSSGSAHELYGIKKTITNAGSPIRMTRYKIQRKRYHFCGKCCRFSHQTICRMAFHIRQVLIENGLKTLFMLFNIKEIEKRFLRCFPSLINLILLHTVVAVHNTSNTNGMLDQRGGRLSKCSKTNYHKSSLVAKALVHI